MTAAVAVPELDDSELELSEEDLRWLQEIGNLEGKVYGSTEPRIFTPPLRDLDQPDATLGHGVIAFATEILGVVLWPWQRWWLIHALELRPDGQLRFSTVVTLVARQNGKTFLITVLALYFLYIRGVRLVLGSAQKVDTAKESWNLAYDLAEENEELAAEFVHNYRGKDGKWEGAGASEIRLTKLPGQRGLRRYKVTASTEKAGRGLSVDLLILDEIRHLVNSKAWAALSKTTAARAGALTVAISNAGEQNSIILRRLRVTAMSGRSPDLAIFEWSAPDGCALNDMAGWIAANPGLGYGRSLRKLALDMIVDDAATFRTEVLCQWVLAMDLLVDPVAWGGCKDDAMTLDDQKGRIALCLDVAPDGAHATLVAAALTDDGRVKLEVIKSWKLERMGHLVEELDDWIDKIGPRRFGWFPNGPAAAYGSQLRKVRRAREITQVTEACQELVTLIKGQRAIHAGDPLLTAHITGVRKLPMGDGYRFVRRGVGHCDAAYAAAGAAKLAQSMRGAGMKVV